MIDFLLSLPTWLGSLVSIVLTTGAGITIYFVSYRLIFKYQKEDLKDSTSNLFRVIGLLVGLMLSLAFAEVIVEIRQIENAIQREAVAISDAATDLEFFDKETTFETRALLADYLQAVIEDDWPELANDKLGHRAGQLRKELLRSVMNLEPETAAQTELWARIVADIDAISDYRLIRLDNALAEPPVYIYVVFFGFLLTMACFGSYRPQGPLVALVALYTIFIGIVLYIIMALSDPFQGGFGIDPITFEQLLKILRSDLEV